MRPLVAPAGVLSAAEAERYARHTVMAGVGEMGQRRLKNAKVLCIGAGGLGSPALLYLAAAGVGTLGVVDDDVVSESNLQRQVLYTSDDLGQPKTAVAARRLRQVNPHITVVEHRERLTEANAERLLREYDLVIDGADNFSTRYLVNDTCVRLGLPDVMGSVLQFTGQVSVFWAATGPCYRCVFPEQPAQSPSCTEAGVFGALCGTVGSWLATEALKLITGHGTPLVGRLQAYDAERMALRQLQVVADPECVTCSQVERVGAGQVMDIVATAAVEVAAALASPQGPAFRLIDIREPHEVAEYAVVGAETIPQREFLARAERGDFPLAERLVLFCHAGVRSANAVRALQELGHQQVSHIAGGIVEWIDHVDTANRR